MTRQGILKEQFVQCYGVKMVTSKKNARPKKTSKIKDLTSIADVIARSHSEIEVDLLAPLTKKSNDPEILNQLLEIERAIIKKALAKGII